MGRKTQAKEGQQNNVWRRGNNYYLRIKINGKDTYKNFGSDFRKAELAAAEYKKQRAAEKLKGNSSAELVKLFATPEKITMEQACVEYLNARSTKKASTISTYENYFHTYIKPLFGPMNISQITEEQIEEFLASLSANKLSGKYANDVVRFARAVCNSLIKRKRLERNPFQNVNLLSEETTNEKIDPLTPTEIQAILEAAPPHYKPIFTILALTGMRPSEAFALKWGDIKWKSAALDINKARVSGVESSPKTKGSTRTVELTPHSLKVLKELRATSAETGYADHVFLGPEGKPINKYLDEPWKKLLLKVGIRHRVSYQLRHSYISNCLEHGLSIGWIAKQVGHSNFQMIYEIYAKYIPSSEKNHIAKVAALLDPLNDKP